MEFGAKIKTLRNKRGITQEALAKAMGVTPQTVSKWENDVTMPDVALLPELSVFFGITIDELFSLDVKKQMAAELSKEAMELEPDNRSYISDYCNAMGSFIPDWNGRNHHVLIRELKDFVKRHPENRAASMWLLDNLMADKRLKEAETELLHLEQIDGAYRTVLYRALLAAAKGEKESEDRYYQEMEEKYADGKEAWLVQMALAERETERQNYEKAIAHYEKAMEVQASPKFTDPPQSMAHIYEILGDNEKAVECYKLELKMSREEWGIIAGEEVDRAKRDMERLLNK